ncbi:MAG: DUF2459 domain-containing protein [Acetobacteraceae bacterium]|nr:DUF2459 domain-containing protein [Acetobacteraceae bacterium]
MKATSCKRLADAAGGVGRCLGLLLCCGLAGCSAQAALPACGPDATRGADGVMWVMRQGWHTEVGLPVAEIAGPLGVFRSVFPGVRVLMFGFGKRTFFTAKVETASELVMGPFPGPSAVQVTGLGVDPPDAYDGPVVALALPPGGAARLSAFLWSIIEKGRTGEPRLIAPGLFPGSLFYAGAREYRLGFNCNTFTAAAVEAAGLRASPSGVVWAGGAMNAAAETGRACRAAGVLPAP